MPAVLYIGVARTADRTRIAEYSVLDTKQQPRSLYDDKLAKVLKSGRIEQHDRLTITDKDVGNIHYQADPVFLYMLIAAPDYPQRLAFKLLGEAREIFETEFPSEMKKARTSGLTKSATPVLAELLETYQEATKVDKIKGVTMQVDEVKEAMQNNITAALKNQDNLETLLDNSDTMRTEAQGFSRSTTRVKEQMRWKSIKMTIIAGVLVVVLILAIVIPWAISSNKEGSATPATPSS